MATTKPTIATMTQQVAQVAKDLRRQCTVKWIHPMSGGSMRTRLDGVNDYLPLSTIALAPNSTSN